MYQLINGSKSLPNSAKSIVCDGCNSQREGLRSVLFPVDVVERDASFEESIVFDDDIMEPRAKIGRAIIDEEARICADISIVYDLEMDRKMGRTVSDSGIVVVPRRMDVKPV
jgi:glucose-1-phosphate adenylyltransferase